MEEKVASAVALVTGVSLVLQGQVVDGNGLKSK